MHKIPFSHTPYNDPSSFNLFENAVIYQDLKYKDLGLHVIDKDGKVLFDEDAKSLGVITFIDHIKKFTHFELKFCRHPHMVLQAEGNFTHLDNLILDSDLVDYLNKTSFHIFFYEIPLLSIDPNYTYRLGYASFTDQNIETEFPKFKYTVVGSNQNPTNCYELDCISRFVERNKLTNVHVYSPYYRMEDYFKDLNFYLHTFDLFLYFTSKPTTKEITLGNFKEIPPPSPNEIEYKFISFSKRYTGIRELITAYLYDKSAQLSYIHKHLDFEIQYNNETIQGSEWNYYWENIDRRLPFEFSKWQSKYPNQYNQIVANQPFIHNNLELDQKITDHWKEIDDFDLFDTVYPIDYIKKSFVQVVTESVFGAPFGYSSEKTLLPLRGLRPFIMVAPPHTLEYLHTIGYKTFNDFWDESYDKETDHEKRLIKILDIIDKISIMSIDECRQMYKQMIPILVHNNKNILNNFRFRII